MASGCARHIGAKGDYYSLSLSKGGYCRALLTLSSTCVMSKSFGEGEPEGWLRNVHKRPHPGRLVDYIILAEFDIDTGSTVRHQV